MNKGEHDLLSNFLDRFAAANHCQVRRYTIKHGQSIDQMDEDFDELTTAAWRGEFENPAYRHHQHLPHHIIRR